MVEVSKHIIGYIDLQVFAEEDEGRTLEPTEYRLRKAREEGNIPQSQELASVIILLAVIWSISFLGMTIFKAFYELNIMAINLIGSKDVSIGNVSRMVTEAIKIVMGFLVPLVVISLLATILGHGLQTRFIVAWKKLTPNFRKVIDIPKNFKKIFFSRDTFFNLVKSIVKVFVFFFIGFLVISSEIYNLQKLVFTSPMQSFFYISGVTFKVSNVIILTLLALSLLDYLYQRWTFRKSLMMTPRELKQEIKEFEGDPYIKARIRELEQQLLQRRSLQEVPKADVVITNPRHYAVALKYDPSYMSAPTVVAKGVDALALRIKKIAQENGIEVVENRALARALYKSVDIGEEIPPEYYQIIANILSIVYKKRGTVFG